MMTTNRVKVRKIVVLVPYVNVALRLLRIQEAKESNGTLRQAQQHAGDGPASTYQKPPRPDAVPDGYRVSADQRLRVICHLTLDEDQILGALRKYVAFIKSNGLVVAEATCDAGSEVGQEFRAAAASLGITVVATAPEQFGPGGHERKRSTEWASTVARRGRLSLLRRLRSFPNASFSDI